ncbi:hypothetical protein SAMN05444392_102266 [Seinonella peptonophila]|uniref:Holin n=1 Tax=Seinonella peptonophila TaxID=112248 RepID=A0A1M4VAU7_9BACL|nr:hypothetical protein [Seinonella peptonophila]SHE66007.1 hypothetical protein SAMN05444392_102266 [Seinonella peptonophila]
MNLISVILRDPKAAGLLFAFLKVLFASVGVNITDGQLLQWEEFFNLVCSIAIALGIFGYSPTDSKGVDK